MGRKFIGAVNPGDYVSLSRNLYIDQSIPTILSAVATVSIYGHGNLVAVFPANVTAITPAISALSGNKTAVNVDFDLVIPDTLTPSADGDTYTAVFNFVVTTADGAVDVGDVQEAFTVNGTESLVFGARPEVVLIGTPAELTYTFQQLPASVTLTLYFGNDIRASYPVSLTNSATTTWVGNTVTVTVDTTSLTGSLMPYAALWTIDGNTDAAPLFMITPSINLAMVELHNWVNKNCSDWATKELTFTSEQLIAALYNGACLFNSEASVTNFTMLNAQGAIRAFWLQYSAVWLLQSQVLNGIETDFSYAGQSVTLDVDRAAKYQQFADSLENALRDRVKTLKVALSKRGQIDGDGSQNPMTLRLGAIGALGIAMSPVSKAYTLYNPMSWRAALLNPGLMVNTY